MREKEIRLALKKDLYQSYPNKHGIIIDELAICEGSARIDIAVIGEHICGYEIKSEFDSFKRFASQAARYNRCFEYVTLVISSIHLQEALAKSPDWWSVTEVINADRQIEFIKRRVGFKNPSIDPNAVVQLLWRDEAAQILENVNKKKSVYKKRRKELWSDMVGHFDSDSLCKIVKNKLLNRVNWRDNLSYIYNLNNY